MSLSARSAQKCQTKTLLCWILLTVLCTVRGHNGDINIVERAATTEGRV